VSPWEGKEDGRAKKFESIRRRLVFLQDREKSWEERTKKA